MATLSDSDSAPELSGKSDTLAADSESSAEEQGGGREGDEEDGEEEDEREVEEEADLEANGGEEYDEEQEVVVEEEVDEEDEEEKGEGDGGEELADLSDKDDEVTGEKLKSEEHGDGLKSITPERSNSKPTTPHSKDEGGGNLIAYDGSDDTDIVDQLEKETFAEASKDGEEAHGSHQPQLALGESMGGEYTGSLQVQENELAVESKNVMPDSVVEKELPPTHRKPNSQTPPENSSLSSMRTPQRRPRSSSPGSIIENANKRPASICDFFARGWCIKGNSCKFLHQKEGVFNTTQQMGEDQSGPSRKGDFLDNKGSREEAERLRLSASQEVLGSSNTESSSKSPSLKQRALVRAYGGEKLGSPQFHDEYDMHGAHKAGGEFLRVDVPQSGRASNPPLDDYRQTLVREEYKRPFGVSSHFDSADERQLVSDDFLSRRYLNEGKLHQEMPTGDSPNVSPFTRGSSLTRNTLVPEFRYYSRDSSTPYSLYQNSNNPLAYDKRKDVFSIQNQESHLPRHGSYSPYSLTSSFNSSFSNPTQSVLISSSSHALAHGGTSSTRGEQLDSRMDRGNYGSRSASLPRNSPPFYSRTEVQNIAQHNIVRDLPATYGKKTQLQDAWVVSVPFQSSFCSAPANTSSPGSQYDPLLDSIESPKAGNITFQTSQRTIIHNVSSQHMNGHPILSGSHTPGYNAQNPPNLFPRSHEGILGKDTSTHGLSGYTAVVAAPGPSTFDGGNNSMPKEGKHLNPGHVVDDKNNNEGEPGGNLRSQEDKGRNNKEPKALKFFRSALIDFVKELVKPSWREGHLSKDAHKMIVKKAAEKVLSAMQPHQVPSTTESINQYLSTSRPKLLKLVEGYVDKYTKS